MLGQENIIQSGNTKGVPLTSDWFGLACFANKNKNCVFIQPTPNHTGCQWYSPSAFPD
jgi:hypothetical protein